MRIVLFCHSLVSDWNHGNAHFLRGLVRELGVRGHDVRVFEPADGWSRRNLLRTAGSGAVRDFARAFPGLRSRLYDRTLDVDEACGAADLVLVHEWNEPWLVSAVGRARARGGFRALFHDTHHRAATAPEQMAAYDLSQYDGVLAFGAVIRELYLERGWAERAWVWHEAADTELFRPCDASPDGDLVWIGNWGDDERTAELHELLIGPSRRLGLAGTVHGVRYPRSARRAVGDAGLRYGGWVANHRVPDVFARHRVTVHVPRRPYVEALPGIPTIRVFEALACAMPLVSAPWEDAERLFSPDEDFLVARNGREMESRLREVLADPEFGQELAQRGRRTVLERHTCAHRVDELLDVCRQLGVLELEAA
jgi:spore maturation protein CgeB